MASTGKLNISVLEPQFLSHQLLHNAQPLVLEADHALNTEGTKALNVRNTHQSPHESVSAGKSKVLFGVQEADKDQDHEKEKRASG